MLTARPSFHSHQAAFRRHALSAASRQHFQFGFKRRYRARESVKMPVLEHRSRAGIRSCRPASTHASAPSNAHHAWLAPACQTPAAVGQNVGAMRYELPETPAAQGFSLDDETRHLRLRVI